MIKFIRIMYFDLMVRFIFWKHGVSNYLLSRKEVRRIRRGYE